MRNRILRHVRIRAGDLVPHESNPRVHSPAQRRALQLLYDEIGFARSLLAYELPDGRLKIIDGHLRASMHPNEEVNVEVLDVNDAEARALLLAIDPLAQIAGYRTDMLERVRQMVEKDSAAVKSLWQTLEDSARKTRQASADRLARNPLPQQFMVLIECDNEAHQIELLERFRNEGLQCQAKIS